MSTVWINTGEVSGDLQASRLLLALKEYKPNIQVYGMGNEALATAGQKNLLNSNDLSVMGVIGISEVIKLLPRIFSMLNCIEKELTKLRPDVVILVDAPDFNFRVAKIARKLGLRVCYFIPPKIWAWRTGRIEFLRKYTDSIISILPFEKAFYQKYGMEIDYVGNPLIDLVNWEGIRTILPIKGRIGIMPGSRKKEVENLLPEFADAARRLLKRHPDVTFFCIRAPNISEGLIRAFWDQSIPLQIEVPENRYAAMRTCEYILSACGTAVLETALVGVPTIITYKVTLFSEILARLFIKVKWAGLPNLILEKTMFPELFQRDVCGKNIIDILTNWINNPSIIASLGKDFVQIREKCGDVGSAHRAAQIIIQKFLSC